MAYNWSDVEGWSNEQWDHAYNIFLSNSPLTVLNDELKFRINNHFWVDCYFDINTKIPTFGFHKDVDKRAIVLVIARTRSMEHNNWTHLTRDITVIEDLSILEKLTINSLIYQIYGLD